MRRIGLIGAGWITEAHAPGWEAAHERAKVVAVADPHDPSATRLADRFGARPFADYRRLLDEVPVDAVDICVPPHLHVQIVSDVVERGIHVLCEKPVARDLAEADLIGQAIAAAGITYLPAHNTVHYPTIRRAHEYLTRGDLGPCLLLRSWDCDSEAVPTRLAVSPPPPEHREGNQWRASKSTLGGGALIDGGFHGVYRLLYLSANPVTEVSAMLGRFNPLLERDSEDTAAILLRFSDGSLGEVVISYALDPPTTGPDRMFTASCRDGALSGNEAELQLRLARWDTPSVQELSGFRREIAWRETFKLEISHFLDVLDGLTAPIQTFDDARRALELVRAAYESAESGRTIALPIGTPS